jgi:hypothetical protein
MICTFCQDGLWEIVEAGATSGARRCQHCERGRKLIAEDESRKNPDPLRLPILTKAEALMAVATMAAIPMFPTDQIVRGVIGEEIRSLCRNAQDASWLAKRMVQLYDTWPGPRELRRVYCARKIPHDGVMASGSSEHYPEGIPSEVGLTSPPLRQLASEGSKGPASLK